MFVYQRVLQFLRSIEFTERNFSYWGGVDQDSTAGWPWQIRGHGSPLKFLRALFHRNCLISRWGHLTWEWNFLLPAGISWGNFSWIQIRHAPCTVGKRTQSFLFCHPAPAPVTDNSLVVRCWLSRKDDAQQYRSQWRTWTSNSMN